ncbi:hypothetical protein HO133_006777 [Letharia lupina]|uniref:Uncharacterized protein n=1 Tax=Letharia lupina TaxID=560253 RepID=A0A8H6C684_9LECA|nr:uncharacterized protein HO133_006777 [Letharia lupina]KAF6217675.1 hypothetical protein HO133_006777 [Letharia lupina]
MAEGMAGGEGVRAAYKTVVHIRQAKAPGREDREDRLYNVSNGMRGGSPSRESWAYSNVFPLGMTQHRLRGTTDRGDDTDKAAKAMV